MMGRRLLIFRIFDVMYASLPRSINPVCYCLCFTLHYSNALLYFGGEKIIVDLSVVSVDYVV